MNFTFSEHEEKENTVNNTIDYSKKLLIFKGTMIDSVHHLCSLRYHHIT